MTDADRHTVSKVPEVTLAFWAIKILATMSSSLPSIISAVLAALIVACIAIFPQRAEKHAPEAAA